MQHLFCFKHVFNTNQTSRASSLCILVENEMNELASGQLDSWTAGQLELEIHLDNAQWTTVATRQPFANTIRMKSMCAW